MVTTRDVSSFATNPPRPIDTSHPQRFKPLSYGGPIEVVDQKHHLNRLERTNAAPRG